jgi:hypothetical protein
MIIIVSLLGVFMCDAAAVQVYAEEREWSYERARRAEVVAGFATTANVYVS